MMMLTRCHDSLNVISDGGGDDEGNEDDGVDDDDSYDCDEDKNDEWWSGINLCTIFQDKV